MGRKKSNQANKRSKDGFVSLKTILSLLMRRWCLKHMRAAIAQASLPICAESPQSSLPAHTKLRRRLVFLSNDSHISPLDSCACMFEEWHNAFAKSIKIL